MGVVTVSDSLQEAFNQSDFELFEMYEASAEEFYEAITNGKAKNQFGTFVERHTLEDYLKMDTLLIVDQTAGIAVETDGNIVSVFSDGTNKGVLKTLIPIAIEYGGCKLDNYNSYKLSALYRLYGFQPISKVKFDRRFAPSDWKYDRDGEPEIVFWIHCGDSAADVVRKYGYYEVIWESVKEFPTYEEAMNYRDSVLRDRKLLKI